MHPTQKFVRRRQHDLRTPADLCVSPLAGYSRVTVGSEDAAALELEASRSNRTLFLNLSSSSSPMMLPPDASACRTATCSSSLFPGSMGTSPAPRSTRALFLSLTHSVSAILSLYAFILPFPVKVLSMIVLILSQHSSLCGFVAFPCDATSRVTVSFNVWGQNTESSGFNFWCSFIHNPWQCGSRSFFVSCDFLSKLPFWGHFVDSQASLSVCLVQLLPRTTPPFLVMHKTAPVRS